ncbi:MAG: hypothetical protein HeimAB125_11320 [Candidatus Heimdallarchaeota archaeon AB_125]|nr:MAG: hypothetical protein HeimAB125_11320 [Candidatus Heimdallarchaeota archaeon AB_125]
MVDWSVFGTDLLAAVLSSVITLIVGWGIAWKLIHSYQRRNTERQNAISIIDGISSFKSALRKTTDSWLTCRLDESDTYMWYTARAELLDIGVQRETLYLRILNQYPEYFTKEFETLSVEGKTRRFNFNTIVETFRKYRNLMSDSLLSNDFSDSYADKIIENEREIAHYLSVVMYELIREPLAIDLLKKIDDLEKK